MGNTRDQVGKAGLFVAGGIFRTAFYVCVAVLIFWIGKSAYQFGYNVFNQQAVSPGAGQEVTVVIPEGSSTYDVAKILKSKGLIDDSLVFFAQEKLSTYKGQMQAGTYLLSTAYTPTRIMGILAGDEEQTGVTQDSATAADTAVQTDTQTTDAGTDTADTQSADGTADTQAADGTAVSAVWKSTNQFTAGNTAVPEGVSAVGGKTGTTTAARSCLVQLFTDAQGQRYVAIILGCKERAILYEEMLSFLSNLNN